MANWESFIVKVPVKDPLEKVRNLLEQIVIFLDVLKAILETIKIFLIDFGNPLIALIRALLALIIELFEALKQTGLYGYFDIPDPTKYPGFNLVHGGFQAFTARFKGSLFDSKDPNRPQPRPGSTKSGFIILMVDASDPFRLLRLIMVLLRFFSREFTSPQYAAPSNPKVLPIGDKNDPIVALAKVFNTKIVGLAVEWSMPTTIRSPDPGFLNLVGETANQVWAPKYLIEKSAVPTTTELDYGSINAADSAGILTTQQPTNFASKTGTALTRKGRVRDANGDLAIKFQRYYVVSPGSNPLSFILGQLGKFRYIDKAVEPDVKYFYRIRAFSGELAIDENTHTIAFPKLAYTPEGKAPIFRYPSKDPANEVVMGKATGIMEIRVPKLPANFDVIANLTGIFQVSFALNFHLPVSDTAQFSSTGQPVGATPPTEVGKGSLVNLAGTLGQYTAVPIVSAVASQTTLTSTQAPPITPDPITGLLPELPWQQNGVIFQSARLTNIVAGSLLENGGTSLEGFRNLMQGALPRGPITAGGNLAGVTTLEQLVLTLTKLDSKGNATNQDYATYALAFKDTPTRLNVLAAVSFVKSFTLGGAPQDWISISILRDIIPWSGQFLYELLAKLQALLDAFKGVMDEIKDFIDLLIRKINALEAFIEFLINILNFIESLQVGTYLLKVGPTSGGVQDWVQQIDTAGGTVPPSGPGGYSAGVALGYVAVDPGAFVKALDLIF